MKNLQALRDKVANKAKVIVTPFTDGTVVQELANGWKKIRIDQVVTKRTNAGTAMIARDQNRTAFLNISGSDFELYGDYLNEGTDYNTILEVIGETKKVIALELSLEPFYPTQEPVKYKDAEGNLIEATTREGNVFYKRGILAEIGTPDIWGTNEPNEDTGFPEFKAFSQQEDEVEAQVATAEAGDLA